MSSVKEYLQHILEETNFLRASIEKLRYSDFSSDEVLKRAFARSVEIIGEAVKKLPDDFRKSHPDIDWRAIAGMRDKLIHDYFGIDYELLWDVVRNEIPPLRNEVKKFLDSEKS